MEIMIDNKPYEAEEGMTILEAAEKLAGTEIPALCSEERLGHVTSCFLCCVEVEGSPRLLPACSTPVREGMKILTGSPAVMESRRECLSLLLSEHCGNCVSPCTDACPAGVDVRGYLKLSGEGRLDEAVKLIRERNPLPSVCGRVCVRFCEDKCRRRLIDDSVAINAVKRAAAESGTAKAPSAPPPDESRGTAAVIGSGPAGLSFAYYSAMSGVKTTVYEAMPKIGGMLRYGIPSYRLPRRILDGEIDVIKSLGVEFRTGIRVGRDVTLEEIRKSHDRVFIATGAWLPSPAGMEGEDAGNVMDAISFLSSVEDGETRSLEGTVIVIGGGNSAMDAARTAVRLGAAETVVLYRRTRPDMPADPEETEDAEREGVRFVFLASPKRALKDERGNVRALECVRMRQGEKDSRGRRGVSPIEGSEFEIPCSRVIVAAGQKCSPDFAGEIAGIIERGRITADPTTQRTGLPGVLAGGDAVTGAATVIEAIAAGRRAAVGGGRPGKACSCGAISKAELEGHPKMPRSAQKKEDPAKAAKSFDETERAITRDEIAAEADRCLDCGCHAADRCLLKKYAEEYGVSVESERESTGKRQEYVDLGNEHIRFEPEKCILCQRCIATCERASGRFVPGLYDRGYDARIAFEGGKSLSDTACVSCGNCIDSCAAGALQDRAFAPFETEEEGTCVICGGLCRVKIRKGRGKASVRSARDMRTGFGDYLCSRGRYCLPSFHDAKTPMLEGKRASFEEAAERAVEILLDSIKRLGPDATGVILSSFLTDEEAYAAVKLGKGVIGTDCVIPYDLAEEREFSSKKDLVPIQAGAGIEDISKSDLILAVSGNIERTCFKAAWTIREAVMRGARLVCIGKTEEGFRKFAAAELDNAEQGEIIRSLAKDEETIALFRERDTKITAVCPASHLSNAPDLAALLKKCGSLSGEGRGLVILNSGANTSGAIKAGAFPGLLPGGLPADSKRGTEIYLKSWGAEALPGACRGKGSIRTGLFIGEMPEKGMYPRLERTILLSPVMPKADNMPDAYLPFGLSDGAMTGPDGVIRRVTNNPGAERTLREVLALIAEGLRRGGASIVGSEDKIGRHVLGITSITWNASEE